MKWTCKDGRVMEMSEMSTSHLKNTIAMLGRKGWVTHAEFTQAWVYAYSPWSGEMAADAVQAELDNMIPSRRLEALENELVNRGKQ